MLWTSNIVAPAQVLLDSVERFIRVVGEKEDAIFQRRGRMLQRDKQRRARDGPHGGRGGGGGGRGRGGYDNGGSRSGRDRNSGDHRDRERDRGDHDRGDRDRGGRSGDASGEREDRGGDRRSSGADRREQRGPGKWTAGAPSNAFVAAMRVVEPEVGPDGRRYVLRSQPTMPWRAAHRTSPPV